MHSIFEAVRLRKSRGFVFEQPLERARCAPGTLEFRARIVNSGYAEKHGFMTWLFTTPALPLANGRRSNVAMADNVRVPRKTLWAPREVGMR